MKEEQRKVKDFMLLAKQTVSEKPVIATEEVRKLRIRLQMEELLEYAKAAGVTIIDKNSDLKIENANDLFLSADDSKTDLVEIADSLADQLYILLGTALAHGIDLEPIFEAVHKSNLEKFGPGGYRREDGKWQKPKDWKKPDLQSLLKEQFK